MQFSGLAPKIPRNRKQQVCNEYDGVNRGADENHQHKCADQNGMVGTGI